MKEFFQAFIEFLTDFFAALTDFLGDKSTFDEYLEGLDKVLDNTTPEA